MTPELTHTFQVTNTTDRAVSILGEDHSCSCSSVSIPRTTLRPGQSLPLTISLSVPNGEVERTVWCTVKTDHPRVPEWSYALSYKTLRDAKIVPERIELGQIPIQQGDTPSGEFPEVVLELQTPASRQAPRPVRTHAAPNVLVSVEPNPFRESFEAGY